MTNVPSCHNPNNKKGTRPFIIPIFIPHAGCPHQCAFCNQTHIADCPEDMPSDESIMAEITRFLGFQQAHHEMPQISFYGGTFLGIGKKRIRLLLDIATRFISMGQAASIRFSTRPDTITPATMDLIQDYPVKTIELGVQSMDDRVLQRSLRGHSALDTHRAVAILKERGYDIGLQMMIGLPSQDESSAMSTAHEIAALRPDMVRIYPAIVLKNSHMESWYREGVYEPLSLETAVAQTKRIYALFNDRQIAVIRMGLQASESLGFDKSIVAGPYHPAFGHLVLSAVFLEKAEYLLGQLDPGTEHPTLRVHPRNESRLRGLQNSNIKSLMERFCLKKITVLPDSRLSMETVELDPLS